MNHDELELRGRFELEDVAESLVQERQSELAGPIRISAPTAFGSAELVRALGRYMTPRFAENYGVFFEGHNSLKEFLLTVDGVIHVEVRKLYPEAGLPEFTYDNGQPDKLTMLYKSQRKLCALAEGLIEGSAEHFNENCSINHEVCMHKGSDHCALELSFAR